MKKIDTFQAFARGAKSLVAILLVMLMAVGNLFADQVTFNFSEQGYTNAQDITGATINDYLSFTCAQESGNNAPKYYNTGTALRLYGGNTLTITATDAAITGIEFTFASGEGTNAITANEGTYGSGSWTGDATSIIFTIGGSSGHRRVQSFTITYTPSSTPSAVAAPTMTPAAGTYTSAQSVTLASSTEGATIYYTVDGTEPTTASLLYQGAIPVTTTTTIKAIAVLGENTSAVVSATYTIPVVANIAAFKALPAGTTIYQITGDVVVLGQYTSRLFVQDESGALLIYGNYLNNNYNYNPGDVISGGVFGSRAVYNGLNEMNVSTTDTYAAGVAGTPVEPTVHTVAELIANYDVYETQLVTIENVVVTEDHIFASNSTAGKSASVTQDDNTIVIFNCWEALNGVEVEAGEALNVTGFLMINNGNYQIAPRNSGDIEVYVAPVEPLDYDAVAELPYTYNFDEGADPYFVIDNAEYTNAWYIGQAQGFDNNKLYISSNGGTTNKYNITSASNVVAYRDLLIPATGAVLSFDYRAYGEYGEGNDYLLVSLGTTEIAHLSGENDWASFHYDISGEMAGVVRLQFTWVNNATYGNQFPAAIDNISVIETPCSQPTALTATVDSTTAVITWQAVEGQTAWNLQYKLANHSEWYTVAATETSVTLNDLQGNSNYDMRVQAVCGENTSAWTNGVFAVDCQNEEVTTFTGDVAIGDGTTTNGYLPFYGYYGYTYSQQIIDASEINATSGNIYSVSYNCSTAPASSKTGNIKIWMANTTKSVFDNNTDYVDPSEFTLVYEYPSNFTYETGWNTFTLTTPFEYTGGNVIIAYYEGMSGYSSSSFYTHSTSDNKSIAHYSDTESSVSYTNPASASGSKYFSMVRNNMKLNMDRTVVTCEDAIACVDPSNLEVSEITANSVMLTWTAGEEGQTDFVVEYMAEGATEWTSVDVEGTTYTLSGLAQLTNYSVRVKANCGTNNWSDVVTTDDFRTIGICSPVTNLETSNVSNTTTLNWTAGGEETAWLVQFKPATAGDDEWTSIDVSLIPMTTFGGLVGNTDYDVRVKALCDPNDAENQSEWTSTTFHSGCAAFEVPFAEEFTTGAMPTCWENQNFSFSPNGDGYAFSNTNGAELITPAINIPAENPTYLTFKANGTGNYTILASYRGTNADRFAEIYTGTASSQYETIIIAIPDLYKGRAINFKIVNNSNSYQYFYYVDVNQCPFVATDLTAGNATDTTIDLAWSADEAATNFQIQYGIEGFNLGEGTIIDVPGATAVTVDGLTFETTYDFYVRVVCGGDNGEWVGPVSASTALSCSAPTITSVEMIGNTSSLMVSWTPGEWGTPIQYNVRYRVVGEEEYTTEVVEPNPMTTTTFLVISNLQSMTTYEVGVQSICGVDKESEWATRDDITTPCVPMDLPYVEGFEASTSLPQCWEKIGSGTVAVQTSTVHSGSRSLKFSGATSNVIAMPAVNANSVQISFYTRPESFTNASCGEFDLGLVNSSNDFTALYSYVYNEFSSYTEITKIVTIPEGSKLAFRHRPTSTAWYWFVDDINIDLVPTCPKPTAITVGTVTETTAQVSWTAGGTETEWEVSYTVNDQTITVTTTNNPYTITGLSASAHYVIPFSVKAICSATDESEVVSTDLSFNTACGVAAIPFTENFDAYTSTTSQTTMVMPACWNRKYTGTSTSYGAGIYNSSSYAVSGTNSLRLYNGYLTSTSTAYGDVYAVMPMVDAALNTLMVSFNAKKSTTTSYGSHFEVGVVTDNENPETSFTTVEAFDAIENDGDRITVSLANYDGPAGYIAFRSAHGRPEGTTYTTNYVYIDNLVVETIPTCMMPSSITVGTVTETTAQVSWIAGGTETEWEVSYTVNDQTVTETTTNNPYTINGLTASTHYVIPFNVKAICSATEESVFANKELNFNTVCAAFAVPYVEDFDSYTGATSQSSMVMPVCWNSKFTGTSTAYGAGICSTSGYAVSTPNTLRFYNYCTTSTSASYGDIYVVLPQVDAAINELMVSFDAKPSTSTSYSSFFEIGVITDVTATDYSSVFQPIGDVHIVPESGQSFNIVLSDYTGANGNIAFRVTKTRPSSESRTGTYTYVYIDNLAVETLPTCFAPTQLSVSGVTDHAAVVTWNDSYDQANYAVEYKAEGDAVWTSVSSTTTSISLSNLQASTNYTLRVKAVCGTGDESEYTEEVEFTTNCDHGVEVEFTGTSTSSYIPVYGNYNYSYSQQIFKSTEINAATTISGFEIEVSNTGTGARNISIYMMHTSENTISSWLPMDNAQLVYTGVVAFTEGWQQITFDTPFDYNGTDNLVLIMDDNTGTYGSYPTFRTHSAGSGISRYYYNDYSNPDPFNPGATAAGTSYSYRNNIRIVNCPDAIDLSITSISEFNAACDVEGAVTIGVKNNGYEGTVSAFEAYYQVNDGTPVQESVTLATPIAFNETAEYTFGQLPVFTAGENIITAWVELTGDLVDGNNTIASAPITVLDPKAVPYREYFWEPIGWNAIDANNDGITMVVDNQGVSYSFSDEVAADDWMMSPCVELAAGTYTVIYDYAAVSSLTESFEVFYGNGAHIADMTNLVATHTFNNTGVEIATTTITVPTDGIYNFGFHATSLAGNLGFNIYYFSVQPVNDVTVTFNENGGTVTPNGTVAVNYGEDLTLNLLPDPMYHVAGVWVDNVQVVPEDGTGANFMLYTLENVTEPHTVFVDFKLEFHIIKTVENYGAYEDLGGAFVPAAIDTTLEPDPFTVNMVADPHYTLYSLTVSPMVPDMPEDVTADVTDNGDGTYSYTIDTLVVANYYLNATFKRDQVAINYNVLTGKGYADESGLLSAGDTYATLVDYSVNHDVDFTSTITAAEAEGYHIVDVIVDNAPQGRINSWNFQDVTADHNVDLKFGYMVTTSVSNFNTYDNIQEPQGDLDPDTLFVPEFDPMTVYGTVAEHFHLYQLLVNGENRIDEVVFGADPHNYSFTMDSVDNNYTIEAVVKVDTFAIIYNVVAGQGYADESDLLVAPDTFLHYHNYGDDWFSTITPATGFAIGNVMLDDQNLYTANNYQFNYLEASHVFTINFAPVTYTITTNAYGEGTVSDGITFTYDPNNAVDYVFTATPAEGYYISSITINNEAVDLTGIEGEYTTTIANVADNYAINVIFQMYTYTMTGAAGFGGNITPSGSQSVNYGTDLLYQIVAEEGYYIQTIYVDNEIVESYTQADGMTAENVSFTAIDSDHEVYATFEQFMYTITGTVGDNGTVNGATTINTTLAYGSNYSMTITPEANYQVADVIIDGVSMGAINFYEFINLTADHNVVVSFEAIMYTLTATSNIAACTITPDVTTVQAGSNVAYTLTAANGYHLENVIANGEEVVVTNNAFTISDVQSDYTIYANFASDYVTVTVNQPAHATITPGTMTYAYGATPSYMIVPETGYEVVSVTAGNAVVNVTYNNGIGTFTLDPVQADITLTATTSIKKFEITVTQGANGTIAPGTQTNVEYGSNKTFTITPNDYYVVADVIVDGSSRGALSSYTFYNVTGNHTITAVFEANCQTPTNLSAFDIDTTSAVLTWVGTAPSYEVRYKAADAASYTTQTVTSTSLTVTGLTPNTLYSWGVRALCGSSMTSDWASNAFTTRALPVGPVIGISNAELTSIKVYSHLNNVYVVNEDGIAISNIDIYDIYGKQVYTGKVVSSTEVISLNVANGNYVVRLTTENGVGVYKVAIVR